MGRARSNCNTCVGNREPCLGSVRGCGNTVPCPGVPAARPAEMGGVTLRGFGLAGLALAAGIVAAAAQDMPPDMKSPRISPAQVDWERVAPEPRAIHTLRPARN